MYGKTRIHPKFRWESNDKHFSSIFDAHFDRKFCSCMYSPFFSFFNAFPAYLWHFLIEDLKRFKGAVSNLQGCKNLSRSIVMKFVVRKHIKHLTSNIHQKLLFHKCFLFHPWDMTYKNIQGGSNNDMLGKFLLYLFCSRTVLSFLSPSHSLHQGRFSKKWNMLAKTYPKKILVLGGDGFCGWPTSLHLSDKGWWENNITSSGV